MSRTARLPLQDGVQRAQQAALSFSRPAPIKGWATRTSIADMDPRFAILLDNWIPREYDCELRGGQANHVTGITGNVDSLMVYRSPSATKMFGANAGNIYDVSSAGAVGAAVVAGQSNGRWQWTNFATSGGYFGFAVNGADDAERFDGTSWTAVNAGSGAGIAITGVLTSALINVAAFKRRLWFVEKTTLDAWYLPLDSIAGAATKFPLGPLFTDGGSLLAIGTLTFDGGDGLDDYILFLTTEGQVAMYSGVDPASFTLIGVFRIPKPLGTRCLLKFGGDLLVITEQGVYPMAKAMQSSSIDRTIAITEQIATAFTEVAATHRSTFGWNMTLFSESNLLLVNVPGGDAPNAAQYVMNTVTGAWCRFRAQPAFCWAVFGNEIYYGGNTKVVKALTGTGDFAANIETSMVTAYTYIRKGDPSQKHIKMVRPHMQANGPVTMQMAISLDFTLINDWQFANQDLTTVSGSSIWDTALWDSGVWAFDNVQFLDWKTVFAHPGFTVATGLRTQTKDVSIRVSAFDHVYERGGIL